MAGLSSQPEPPLEPQSTHDFDPPRHPEYEGANTEALWQNISAMPQHQHFSPEELRLNDYQHNRGIIIRPQDDFGVTPECNGLARAVIPPPAFGFQPFFSRRSLSKDIRSLGASVIIFRVGNDKPCDFSIHESLATSRSEFVRLAIDKDWKEAREGIIPLPEDHPDTFELYQQWLYCGLIPSNSFGHCEKDAKEYRLLVNAFALGERFIDADFKDAVIDAIIDRLLKTGFFDPRLATLVYDSTPPDSKLRKLWQDIYVSAGNPSWLDEEILGDYVHPEFSLDLNKCQWAMRNGQGSLGAGFLTWPCTYHDHVTGRCYKAVGGN